MSCSRIVEVRSTLTVFYVSVTLTLNNCERQNSDDL